MRSFFFVPADKEKFLEKLNHLDYDELIIDFEDSVNNDNLLGSLNNLTKFKIDNNSWIRVPNPIYSVDRSSKIVFEKIVSNYDNIILPKVRTRNDRERILDYILSVRGNFNNLKIILLVENPLILMDLYNIANFSSIVGLGIGSHDYCDEMSFAHVKDNLNYIRTFSLNVGRSLKIEVIDFPSMNIVDYNSFKDEIKDTNNMGLDGKFIIHPWQLSIFNDNSNFVQFDENFVDKVKLYVDSIGGISKFSVAVIDGVIIEKPHLRRILNID